MMHIGRKKTLARLVVAIALIATLAAAGLLIAASLKKKAALEYTEVPVSSATDSKVIEASGNIEAVRSSDLSFASIGLVSAVYVSQGQKVKAGEALAALDDSEQRYRYMDVLQKLEQYRLTGNIRQTTLAELELAMRKTELDRAKITAPFTGFVSKLNIEPGEYVSSGKVALTLVDRSTLVATLQIDEVDIPLVKIGQRVSFTFDALTGRTLDGSVSHIPPVGTLTSQGLAVFNVEAQIDRPPEDLLPGFSFSAQIIVREPRSYLSIPATALVDLPTEPAEPQGEGSAKKDDPSQAPVTQGARTRPAARGGSGTRREQALSALTPEQLQALMERRRAALAAATDSPTGDGTQPTEFACLVPDSEGKPAVHRFLGIRRQDDTVEVAQGLSAGDIILIPAVKKKAAAPESSSQGGGFRIPGLGGPPAGERR